MLRRKLPAFFITLLATSGLWAEEDLAFDELLDADFEDLMNISVVTPSRKSERWLEAPVSTSVLTAKQIRQSGATSIPEALRLMPGMIVREITHGNYDVHIRGLDGIPPNKSYPSSFNKSTLVMIDHRPVYNHFNGAILWQELPIDIHDLDRIEVVRGPVGSVYGANAASGVIHLITQRADSEKGHISWSQGEYDAQDVRARFSGVISDRVSFAGSIHKNQRERTDNRYFGFADLDYVVKEDLRNLATGLPFDRLDERYPDEMLSLEKSAINVFLDIQGAEDGLSRLSLGTLTNEFQMPFYQNRFTPIGVYNMAQNYVGYTYDNSDMHASLNARTADLFSTANFGFDFSYFTWQGSLEYRWIQQDDLQVSVGGAVEESRYDADFLGGKAEQSNGGVFSQTSYQVIDSLQLLLNVRGDYFRVPDKVFWSYSGGANYRFSDRVNGRLFVGRSYQSPFYVETQVDVYAVNPGIISVVTGNRDMDLVTIDTAEVGLRLGVNEDLLLDWDVFATKAKKFPDVYTEISNVNGTLLAESSFREIPVEAMMLGSTLSVQSNVSDALSVNAYVTVQKTDLDDAAEFSGGLSDQEHTATPDVYGGIVLNYRPSDQWNVNLNSYYLDDQAFDHRFVNEDVQPSSVYSTDTRWVLNAKVSYQWNDLVTTYVNGRNLVDSRQPQLTYMDHLNAVWMVGVDVDF